MIDLGYDEIDVFATMAGVALSLGAAGQASRPGEEEVQCKSPNLRPIAAAVSAASCFGSGNAGEL
jgi:hypothetical protein